MSAEVTFKLEPASPPNNVEEVTWCSDTDTELYWTTEELLQAVDITSASKSKVVSKLLENLEKLEDLNEIINEHEDAFSTNFWMEEKMLPIYDAALPEAVKIEHKNTTNPTESLLMEFETVLDAVNNGAFTPPQSPPYQQPILATLESLNSNPIYSIIPNDHTYPTLEKPSIQYMQHSMHQPDVDRELAAVEELVRSRVEIMVPSSPSSSSSNYGDSSSEDPEWSGDQPTKHNKLSRKRSKPYNHEDKKSRKKEQNKNAATRYRMKKKAEVEEILGEEKVLQDDNTKLEINIADLQREIKCLKGLMRDLFRAKGLIN